MKLDLKRRLASRLMKTGVKRVKFDSNRLDEIKEAITSADVRALVKDKAIVKKQEKGVSRVRANKRLVQKRKGRRKGAGSRKGKRTARLSSKGAWMIKIRLQREFIKMLKDKGLISTKSYRRLYVLAKSGFFRSKRHIQVYLKEYKLIEKDGKK